MRFSKIFILFSITGFAFWILIALLYLDVGFSTYSPILIPIMLGASILNINYALTIKLREANEDWKRDRRILYLRTHKGE